MLDRVEEDEDNDGEKTLFIAVVLTGVICGVKVLFVGVVPHFLLTHPPTEPINPRLLAVEYCEVLLRAIPLRASMLALG